ncbi:MAG: hypothetical protein IPH84_11935 [Bacteroidales bacterium]|nr:hypothetical protein [Bacteroidales bacterium]
MKNEKSKFQNPKTKNQKPIRQLGEQDPNSPFRHPKPKALGSEGIAGKWKADKTDHHADLRRSICAFFLCLI